MIRGRLSVAVVLAAASFAAAGCGGSPGSPTILNTEKVERAIEHASLAQRGEHARVSCPSGVHQKKGLVFACTATTAGGATKFTVTELDGAGQVRYEAR
ncbi:MAG: hypothetical protein QOC77_565 [Thermoleophilaceae bacterium]|jgi:hypothetical protein|nr:hypothetical protein [Thermoleophilaceae bacterium]